MTPLRSRVAVVVCSCDKYSDLWDLFFQAFRKSWPTCPLEIFLICNFATPALEGVNTLSVGEDVTWSSNLRKGLSRIHHEYVLLLLEDLIPTSLVNQEKLTSLFNRCVSLGWDYLRLNPTPGAPKSLSIDDDVGRIPPGDWYRSSTIVALWKRAVLLDLLHPQENAWEFELVGSQRTDKYLEWYACNHWNFRHCNLVIKGRIAPGSLRQLRSLGFSISTDRAVMRPVEALGFMLRRIRSALMMAVPRRLRRRVRLGFSRPVAASRTISNTP